MLLQVVNSLDRGHRGDPEGRGRLQMGSTSAPLAPSSPPRRGGTSLNGTGVSGGSSYGRGVWGDSVHGEAGVYGHSTSDNGVYGFSEQGTGIHGRSDQGYAGVFGGLLFAQTYLEMPESVAPAAPDPNIARLFVRDNGGKTQLCVLFPTGAVQVVATEP
jgi:hypothetical protein